MAASTKKLTGVIREILRTWHKTSFDSLPDAYRQTLIAAAETASRAKMPDINWAVEECWIGLRDCGLAKVVTETVAYFFPGTELHPDEFDSLLAVARNADANGLVVRAMVEETWRTRVAERLDASEGQRGPHR